MRILFVWLTCISMCGIITIGWYLSQTIVISIANSMLGGVSGQGLSLLTTIEYVNSWWGPIFDVVVVLWAIMSSQASDVESQVYG